MALGNRIPSVARSRFLDAGQVAARVARPVESSGTGRGGFFNLKEAGTGQDTLATVRNREVS